MISTYNARVRTLFKNISGDPFILSKGQEDIYRVIYDPSVKRATIKAITQYGKSEVASMALIITAIERKEKVLIVAPSEAQAKIIMGKIIEHLFDSPYLTRMIEYSGRLEQLKSERSKSRITFRNGSEIMILTAIAKIVSKEAKNLMGFGATIVLVDESSLIPDELWSKIFRMVGGVKAGKIIQLGNPFYKNHFWKAFQSSRYEKISVDWHQALAEGRITQEFLDEAKEDDNVTPLDWIVFYECKFPEMGAEDSLIPMDWIEKAVKQEGCGGEHKQVGIDVARFGNDKTVYLYREGGTVQKIEEVQKMDTMEVVGWARGFIDADEPDAVAIDVIGIGSGVYDRFEELNYDVTPVNVGESPSDDDAKKRFYNLRAEIFWHLRDLFKPDKVTGKSQISIPDDSELKKELREIRYKYSSEKTIKLEAKDEMKKRLGVSPDKADALALAFYDVEGSQPEMYII